MVLDNNALILGQYYRETQFRVIFEMVFPSVLQLWENLRTTPQKVNRMVLVVDDAEYLFRGFVDPIGNGQWFIFVKAPLAGINEEDFADFSRILVDLLSRK